MAKNPQWRGSLATWRERVRGMDPPREPAGPAFGRHFFDLRGVHGDAALADALWREAFDLARRQVAFAKLLAEDGRDASRRRSTGSAGSRRRMAAST